MSRWRAPSSRANEGADNAGGKGGPSELRPPGDTHNDSRTRPGRAGAAAHNERGKMAPKLPTLLRLQHLEEAKELLLVLHLLVPGPHLVALLLQGSAAGRQARPEGGGV